MIIALRLNKLIKLGSYLGILFLLTYFCTFVTLKAVVGILVGIYTSV